MSAPLPPEAYRYVLRRHVGDLLAPAPRTLLVTMLNPSTALTERVSPKDDDQTVRKLNGFCRRWAFTDFVVVNLYGYRATKPAELWAHLSNGTDVIGPDNNATILREATQADAVLCAWGVVWRDAAAQRVEDVLNLLWSTQHTELLCIGRNGDGSPTHPCMAPYVPRPSTWKVRKEAA